MSSAAPIRQAVILAGGKGTRIRKDHPDKNAIKVMLPVNDRPLLEWIVRNLASALELERITLVVGFGKEIVRAHFGDGARFGVAIEYLEANPDDDLTGALKLAQPSADERFLLLLGDEFYLRPDYAALAAIDTADLDAVVAFTHSNNPHEISKNYAVMLREESAPQGPLVATLEENPVHLTNDCLGVGAFVFKSSVFDVIDSLPNNPRTGRRELVDAASALAEKGRVLAYDIGGKYVNINTVDDWKFADFLAKSATFEQARKSVVIPTYNEAESILFVLRDFHDQVDEIVVADGGSSDDTCAVVERFIPHSQADIILLRGKYVGYGDALRHGIDAATGQIVVMVEADATFRARDIHKMYEYIKDSDMVIGTRTTRQLIHQGANMANWLRFGNVLAAKLIELAWWGMGEPRFTDVGCTFRVFWKSAYDEIKHNFIGLGPEFSPEMMIEFTRHNKRVIEIPVSYYPRIGGDSKHSQGLRGVMKTGSKMALLSLKKLFSKPVY
ncbi:sugar phosphate nucleotidyltransferase [Magnetofaba australis]|uniref:Putative bifunctional glycosyltransferase/sugar pyrophosphorylase n=1 Tax=Magnetofaba australis IT-1 TaxID=1434232 RepID=A0A1Y2JZB1_9PROT|nr:glycosyltransferase [Magnetofaba australis]OSM00226.1 putative bifunctional glycosyltransferase/sugar pyrophosphorylase [Magnetofaba australis IT-1]